MSNRPLLPIHILEEIKDNPAFEHIFLETVATKEVVDNFNRLNKTSLNFEIEKPKSVIDAMIFKSTGYKGFSVKDDEFSKFLIFVYDCVYLPMLNLFNQHQALNN